MTDRETSEHCEYTEGNSLSLSLSPSLYLADLLEGLWTVLSGHPLPLDLCRYWISPSCAPEGGAAAVQVHIRIHRHLLLNYMRRHCRGRHLQLTTQPHERQRQAARGETRNREYVPLTISWKERLCSSLVILLVRTTV